MDIGWKRVSAGAGIISGVIANKAVDVLWRAVFHRSSPKEDDFTEPLRDAIVFSAVSAIVTSVVSQVVLRRTAKWYGLDKIADEVSGLGETIANAK